MMPDFYRGEWCDPTSDKTVQFLKDKTKWENLKVDWQTKVLPFAESKGAKTFGAIGNFHYIKIVSSKTKLIVFKEHVGDLTWSFASVKMFNSKLESHCIQATRRYLEWFKNPKRKS